MTKQIFLPSDGPTGTPSLRTLGTGALQAAAGTDSRLSDSRTPLVHASTHDVGGSDVLKDLTRLAAGPAMHAYIAWTADVLHAASNLTPVAGVVYLSKVLTAHAYVVSTIDILIRTGGTGVTALANCFIGIYDSGGTRRFVSADQSAAWASTGSKSVNLGGSAYTVTATDFIYIALLVGTQSTTAMRWAGFASAGSDLGSQGLTPQTYRLASQLTGQTSLPTSLTLSSNALSVLSAWVAVK